MQLSGVDAQDHARMVSWATEWGKKQVGLKDEPRIQQVKYRCVQRTTTDHASGWRTLRTSNHFPLTHPSLFDDLQYHISLSQ